MAEFYEVIGAMAEALGVRRQANVSRGGVVLTGVTEVDAKLRHLGKDGSKRAVVAGVRAALTPVRRAMRAAINASSASPELKREARKTIGSRFNKRIGGGKQYGAKVGFAVGKKRKKEAVRKSGRAASRVSKGGVPLGVGVSANNIHWFVLGTDARHQKKTGRYTGSIADVFGEVVQRATMASAGASVEAARRKISQVIEREARRRS